MKKLFFVLTLFSLSYSNLFSQEISSLYNEAMEAFKEKNYITAHKLFAQFFDEYNPADELYSAAKYYASESLLQLAEVDGAATGFEYIANNFYWSNFRDDAIFKLGLIYFEKGEYSKSRTNFKLLLEEYPESNHSGSALYWIGETYAKQENLEEAIIFLEEAVNEGRDNKYIDYSIYTLAGIYEKIGDYESAEKYYDQLLTYHRDSPLAVSAQIRIGISYFKLKDYQSSILELNNPILNNLPEELYSESLYLLANSYYRVEEYENAEKTYVEILQTFPSASVIREVKYGLAWSYFQQKKYNDAFKVFNSLSFGKDSIAVKSFFWKAEAKRYSGKEGEAYSIYQEFLERFPESEMAKDVMYQLGLYYFNENNFDIAENYLLESYNSKDNSTKVKTRVLLGEIYLNKGNYREAKNAFSAALMIPGITRELEHRAMFGMGVSAYFLEQYNQTIEVLSDLNFIDPNFENDKVNFYLAEAYFETKNYNKAIDKYNKVNKGNLELYPAALYGKAYSYFNKKDFENAAYLFEDFVRLFPSNKRIEDARFRLADSYYGSKNFEAASRVYRDVYARGDKEKINSPYVYYQYAQALYKAGKISEAINEFSTLQTKFPDSEFADRSLYIIGWIHFQQGNFYDAITRYRNVLSTYPNTDLAPVIHYSIGDAFFNLARYDSAIANYERVLLNYSGSKYVYDAVNGLQYSYVAKGEPEDAIILIDEFVSANPKLNFSDQLFFKKGEIYYSIRNYEKAKNSYQQFVAVYPRSSLVPDAYYWIGKSSANLGQTQEALLYYNRILNEFPESETAASAVIEGGNILVDNDNYNEAIRLYNRALNRIDESPRIAEILFSKGVALSNTGNLPEAYEVFEKVVRNYNETIFADKSKLELGLIELAAERYANAEFYFTNLAKKRTDDIGARAQYYLGISEFEKDRFELAIKEFEKVRTIFGSYDEWVARAFLKMGESYERLNQNRKAIETYRVVLTKHRGDIFGKEAQNKIRALR